MTPAAFEAIEVGAPERAQLVVQLGAAFDLTPQAAGVWVDTVAPGRYFARRSGDTIAASFATDLLELRHGERTVRAVMLQSVCVHPEFRGRGFGVVPADLDGLLGLFAGDAVILSLFDDGLVPYWAARGFVEEYRAEVVSLEECLRRAAAGFTPVVERRFVEEKIAEARADGEEAVLRDGLLSVRRPGAAALSELVIVDARAAWAVLDRWRDTTVALRTIMSYPRRFGLFTPFSV